MCNISLTPEIISAVETTIANSLKNKLRDYTRESKNMPFHYRLLGQDRMALFSFIHSLNTSFGTSIFEPVAQTLARVNFINSEAQYRAGGEISEEAQNEIQNIINRLSTGETSDKINEIEAVRKVCQKGKINKLKTVKVDLFLQAKDNSIHLFDLKTAKPNISNFKDFKRTLLEWIAIFLYKNPEAQLHSYIAIPYNPYEPKPYERWTLKGMLDLDNELKIAGEFWNFLGGENAYEELLNCFERVGIAMREEIDQCFLKFKS